MRQGSRSRFRANLKKLPADLEELGYEAISFGKVAPS